MFADFILHRSTLQDDGFFGACLPACTHSTVTRNKQKLTIETGKNIPPLLVELFC